MSLDETIIRLMAEKLELSKKLDESLRNQDLSMGCFVMIRETLATLDQEGYDGKATPPMMLNDWAAVIIARDRMRIAELESNLGITPASEPAPGQEQGE